MTLAIYDIALDGMREATQKDISEYMALKRAYGKIREAVSAAQTELMATLAKEINPDAPH